MRISDWSSDVCSSDLDGVSVGRYANQDITWETALKQNYALELGLFDKINLQAEYFYEYRTNILMTRSYVPVTMGLSAPVRANVGEASSKGIDASVDYQQSWYNGWWVSGRGNFKIGRAWWRERVCQCV